MALVITIASTGESMRFKPMKERWNHAASPTRHAIEKGADITDFIHIEPLTYGADLFLLDEQQPEAEGTPLNIEANEASFAKPFFLACMGEVLALQTGFGILTNMVLTGWPQERDYRKALPTPLTFEQMVFAERLTTTIPRKIVASGAKETKDLGEWSWGYDADKSILLNIGDAASGSTAGLLQGVSSTLSYFSGGR
jgi:hypothetical protein